MPLNFINRIKLPYQVRIITYNTQKVLAFNPSCRRRVQRYDKNIFIPAIVLIFIT